MRTIAIIAALIFAQPALSQQKVVCPCIVGGPCLCEDVCRCGAGCKCPACPFCQVAAELDMHDYTAACKTAVANNSALLIGIGCEPPAGYYMTYRLSVAERQQHFKGSKPSIVIGVPDGKGWLTCSEYLSPKATVGELAAEAAKLLRPAPVVRNNAIYYQPPSQPEYRTICGPGGCRTVRIR